MISSMRRQIPVGRGERRRARRKPTPGLGSNQDLQREAEHDDDGCPEDQKGLPSAGIRVGHSKRGNHD